jgi:hypothetical protein
MQDRDRPVELLLGRWCAGRREVHVTDCGGGPILLLADYRQRWE